MKHQAKSVTTNLINAKSDSMKYYVTLTDYMILRLCQYLKNIMQNNLIVWVCTN